MQGSEDRVRDEAQRAGIRLALLYGIASGLWIAFSDRALVLLGLPQNVERFVAAIKGEVFAAVTATALYFLVTRYLRRLSASEERHRRLFEHSTEGLTMFRVVRAEDGSVADLVIEDLNTTQAVRLHASRERIVGRRMSEDGSDERVDAYFRLVLDSIQEGRSRRRELHVAEGDAEELVLAYPIEDNLYVVAAMDVTALRRAESALRHQEEWIREAYVDVLDAVTGGKLVLLTDAELQVALGEPLLEEQEITSPSQLGAARAAVRDAIAARYPQIASSHQLLNPLGEALNNALKHAGHGSYSVHVREGRVQVRITDWGPGIDFRTLPKATLVAGYSTAATLGMGFTIMLQLCDRVLISTRPGSTTVVLEIKVEDSEFSHLERMPSVSQL